MPLYMEEDRMRSFAYPSILRGARTVMSEHDVFDRVLAAVHAAARSLHPSTYTRRRTAAESSTRYIPPVFHKTPSECSVDHASGLVFRRPQAASHRRAVVYCCSAVLSPSSRPARARSFHASRRYSSTPTSRDTASSDSPRSSRSTTSRLRLALHRCPGARAPRPACRGVGAHSSRPPGSLRPRRPRSLHAP